MVKFNSSSKLMTFVTITLIIFLNSIFVNRGVSAVVNVGDAESINTAVLFARENHLHEVTIPPGEYRLPHAPQWCFDWKGLSEMSIIGTGVTLVAEEPTEGFIHLSECHNVTLVGLRLLHSSPPFSQGVVQSVDAVGNTMVVKIADGYRQDLTDRKYFKEMPDVMVFTAAMLWKDGCQDIHPRAIRPQGNGNYTFDDPSISSSNIVPGDLVVVRGNVRADVLISNSSAISVEDTTIISGCGYGIYEEGGDGGNFYRVSILRGAAPEGATLKPLLGCNADGLHSNSVRHGPTLDECHLEFTGDDAVAIHGEYSLVTRQEGTSIWVSDSPWLKEGDRLEIVNGEGALVSEPIVLKLTREGEDMPLEQVSRHQIFAGLKSVKCAHLVLSQEVKAQFDFLALDESAVGSDFTVRKSYLFSNRARGILVKSSSGLIENNEIIDSTIAALVVSPEIWWNEGGYGSDITIRNNTIRHAGFASSSGPSQKQAGAVTISSDSPNLQCYGHARICIIGNHFDACDGCNLMITQTKDSVVANNIFKQSMSNKSERGKSIVNPGDLVFVKNCENLVLYNNHAEESGPNLLQPLYVESCQSVEGGRNGIVLVK